MSRTDLRTHIVDSALFGTRVFSRVVLYTAKYPYCVIERGNISPTEYMTGVDDTSLFSYDLFIVHDDGEGLETATNALIAHMKTPDAAGRRYTLTSASETFRFDDGQETPIYQQTLTYNVWH